MNVAVRAALCEAGRVAAAARALGALAVVPGARLRDVCEAVEAEVLRSGAGLAFPVQTSVNETAAHYCPSPEEETVYHSGDLAKLDIGVHVDGWVVDTAVSVSVGNHPGNDRLIEAVGAALRAALAAARPGVDVARLSAAIEATITALGFRPMRNLCGHGVGRWTVHCPPPIPNIVEGAAGHLVSGMVVAVEPFATDGLGLLRDQGEAEVFRFDPSSQPPVGVDQGVIEALRAFHGLPFARRHLRHLPREKVDGTLHALAAASCLQAYPPLVEASGRRVAQAEHTILVGEDGIEILTR